jgi:hypothetical protein
MRDDDTLRPNRKCPQLARVLHVADESDLAPVRGPGRTRLLFNIVGELKLLIGIDQLDV